MCLGNMLCGIGLIGLRARFRLDGHKNHLKPELLCAARGSRCRFRTLTWGLVVSAQVRPKEGRTWGTPHLANSETRRANREKRSLQYLLPERRERQLHCQLGRLVALVEHRIHLDHLEAQHPAVVGDDLHPEVTFALGCAAP